MSIDRIIDANANRAREALRVMEDAARFILDDEALTAALKALRHDLAGALARVEGVELHRDTPGDVGTRLATERERERASAADVAIAAGKRLSEALRAIEEYGKTIDPDFASAIEQLRYRGYEVERRLHAALGSSRRRQWRVCVLLTEALCPHRDWPAVARAVLEAKPDCVQLREKEIDAGELLERARALVEMAARAAPETTVIVNDRPDVALLAGAHGVHLGQGDLPCPDARRLAGRRLLLGVSTSNLEEARRAKADGADYCGVGPMFPTTTKHKPVLAGPAYLREYLAWDGLPHLAIGGITPDNLGELIEVGCRGVAVSAAVCAGPDPGAVVGEMQGRLSTNAQANSETPGP